MAIANAIGKGLGKVALLKEAVKSSLKEGAEAVGSFSKEVKGTMSDTVNAAIKENGTWVDKEGRQMVRRVIKEDGKSRVINTLSPTDPTFIGPRPAGEMDVDFIGPRQPGKAHQTLVKTTHEQARERVHRQWEQSADFIGPRVKNKTHAQEIGYDRVDMVQQYRNKDIARPRYQNAAQDAEMLDVAYQQATNESDFLSGIAQWVHDNQLVVAGGIAGASVLGAGLIISSDDDD